MLVILSPAKTLDMQPRDWEGLSQPEFLGDTEALVDVLRGVSADGLQELMSISEKLALLNVERYRAFALPLTAANARPALSLFKGEVFRNIPVELYGPKDRAYAQGHLRILSGLYGLLRPMDQVFPYRLEMGTGLASARGANLYEFWGGRITEALNRAMDAAKTRTLINLASVEYFNAVRPDELVADIVQPVFKDYKKGRYKTVSFFAKRARGAMTDAILRGRIDDLDALRGWSWSEYCYDEESSTEATFVYSRRLE